MVTVQGRGKRGGSEEGERHLVDDKRTLEYARALIRRFKATLREAYFTDGLDCRDYKNHQTSVMHRRNVSVCHCDNKLYCDPHALTTHNEYSSVQLFPGHSLCPAIICTEGETDRIQCIQPCCVEQCESTYVCVASGRIRV